MLTGFQSLLDQADAFLEKSDPEAVSIETFPRPLSANVGSILKVRVYGENGWRSKYTGALTIRRAELAAKAPGLDDPASGQEIKVRGRVYRIDFTTGDNIDLRVEFSSF